MSILTFKDKISYSLISILGGRPQKFQNQIVTNEKVSPHWCFSIALLPSPVDLM